MQELKKNKNLPRCPSSTGQFTSFIDMSDCPCLSIAYDCCNSCGGRVVDSCCFVSNGVGVGCDYGCCGCGKHSDIDGYGGKASECLQLSILCLVVVVVVVVLVDNMVV